MTKQELSGRVADRLIESHGSGLSNQEVATIVDVMIEEMKASVAEGNTIFLRGFGTLKPVFRKGKPAMDIGRGLRMRSKDKMIPLFRVSPKFISLLNKTTDGTSNE